MRNFVALCLLATTAFALPTSYLSELEEIHQPADNAEFEERLDVAVGEPGSERVKRATCDLLSFQSKWVTPNHAACAAHCLLLFRGFKGGSCKGTVCHCRK